MHAQSLRAVPGDAVVELPGGPTRPVAAHREPSNREGPAFYRAWAGVMGVRRQGLEPRTVALR